MIRWKQDRNALHYSLFHYHVRDIISLIWTGEIVDILFEIKSGGLKKGDALPKLDVGDERSVISASVLAGLRAAIIRTFILACVNISFVRPASVESVRSRWFSTENRHSSVLLN